MCEADEAPGLTVVTSKGDAMKRTVGTVDRRIRGVLAVVALIFASALGFSSTWGIVLVVAAAIMVVTGATALCPVYSALGIETTADDASGHEHLHRHHA